MTHVVWVCYRALVLTSFGQVQSILSNFASNGAKCGVEICNDGAKDRWFIKFVKYKKDPG
jgi:hypothetical protein